jgi:hypothetical protein
MMSWMQEMREKRRAVEAGLLALEQPTSSWQQHSREELETQAAVMLRQLDVLDVDICAMLQGQQGMRAQNDEVRCLFVCVVQAWADRSVGV